MKLFLIGGSGANLKNKEALTPPFQTLPFDVQFLKIINKENPKILLLPTAQERFDFLRTTIEHFKMQYGDYLKCQTDVLLLANNPKKNIKKKLEWADAFIIPGGDPIFLLHVWNSIGFISDFLTELAKEKPVMGISAGAMCLFDGVLSTEDETAQILRIGIGLISGVCMPHFNREKLKELRTKLLKQDKYTVFGIDDNAALYIANDVMETWTNTQNTSAYIFNKNLELIPKHQ